jgi:hypothetical protein
MDDRFAVLSSLPIRTRPGYSMGMCMPKIHDVVTKIEKVLDPPFWRKMLGGVSKDHARAMVAALEEDLGALLKVTNNAKLAAEALSTQEEDGARRNVAALAGYCARLAAAIQEWRKAAVEYCAATYGSRKVIEDRTISLARTCETIGKAIESLSD